MEEFKEFFELMFKYGGTVFMAVLFVIYLFIDRKDRKEKEENERKERQEREEKEHKERQAELEAIKAILKEISASNRNVADSLSLLKTSIDNTNNEFKQHDERAIKNFQGIHEDLIILKESRRK